MRGGRALGREHKRDLMPGRLGGNVAGYGKYAHGTAGSCGDAGPRSHYTFGPCVHGTEFIRDRTCEVHECDAERASDGFDHLARGILHAALHLGEVLRGDASARRGHAERVAPLVPEPAEFRTEHVPPERKRTPRALPPGLTLDSVRADG